MFTQIETALLSLATELPLGAFAFIASFVEEVVAPIPSPTVMMLVGSVALLQERALVALVPLVLLGALGKTLGALVVYTVADKAEDFVMRRFGGFFGVTPEDVNGFREKVGTGARGYVVLTLLRAFPFIPSSVISVGSGLIKVSLPMFAVSTFFGTIVRDTFYLYTGYVGAQALVAIIHQSSDIETYLEIAVVIAVLLYLGYRIYRKRKSR
jgi:membrane protein DedA with SNARE-associated domain